MRVLIGIDEAGYGPLLGPLVVASSVWHLDEQVRGDQLWETLRACVSDKPGGNEWRFVVADSKKVHKPQKGAGELERTVLGFLRATGTNCPTLREVLTTLCLRSLTTPGHSTASALPWYRDLSVALPSDPQRAASDALCEKLSRTMDAAGARLERMRARVVSEPDFNAHVARSGSKASIVFESVLQLIADAGARTSEELWVAVDRLGGRTHYRARLMEAFPERELSVINESNEDSTYRLTRSGAAPWHVRFRKGHDDTSLPVALASMTAKWLREMLMARFNAYWRSVLPEVKPTAGYYTDAQRFLAEIDGAWDEVALPRSSFVRSR